MTSVAPRPAPRPDGSPDDNQVFLRGVFAGPAQIRVLPSGDELASFRITVRRAPGRGRSSRVTVDCIDCQAGAPAVRRMLDRVTPGEAIEVTGMLRRRFWRAAGGPASRYEVEVSRLRRAAGPTLRSGRGTGA